MNAQERSRRRAQLQERSRRRAKENLLLGVVIIVLVIGGVVMLNHLKEVQHPHGRPVTWNPAADRAELMRRFAKLVRG